MPALAEFGLTDSRLEPFTFAHGWSLEKISVEMTEPRYMPLTAYAEAWTPGLSRVVTGRVVYIGNKTPAEVQTMAEQLQGAIVLRDLTPVAPPSCRQPFSNAARRPPRPATPEVPSSTPAATQAVPEQQRTWKEHWIRRMQGTENRH